jgi:hypothetical protein
MATFEAPETAESHRHGVFLAASFGLLYDALQDIKGRLVLITFLTMRLGDGPRLRCGSFNWFGCA